MRALEVADGSHVGARVEVDGMKGILVAASLDANGAVIIQMLADSGESSLLYLSKDTELTIEAAP